MCRLIVTGDLYKRKSKSKLKTFLKFECKCSCFSSQLSALQLRNGTAADTAALYILTRVRLISIQIEEGNIECART